MTVPRSTPSPGDTFVSSRRITGTSGAEYGYIAMAGFYLEAAPEISAALDSLMDVAGLVIDVRGNSGGLSAVGDALMGRLLDAPTEGERLHFRGVPTEYAVTTIEPVAPVYSGPVVVLIDEGSYSEGHVLPGLLREIGRATLVGRATGGGNGTPEPWQLTTAMGVSVSTWMTALASGAVDEVTGTEPDVEVVRTAADILDGLYTGPGDPEHDIVLRTALEELGD
jgi:carboxyl-terminal processing protease